MTVQELIDRLQQPTPLIPVFRLYDDGNAYIVLAKCRKAAKQAGWTPERIETFITKAKDGDYDHLLQTVMKHFEEKANEED